MGYQGDLVTPERFRIPLSAKEIALWLYSKNISTEQALVYMTERGQSVILNWGEDTSVWKCSWITSGKRFTGVSNVPGIAVYLAVLNASEHFEALKRATLDSKL